MTEACFLFVVCGKLVHVRRSTVKPGPPPLIRASNRFALQVRSGRSGWFCGCTARVRRNLCYGRGVVRSRLCAAKVRLRVATRRCPSAWRLGRTKSPRSWRGHGLPARGARGVAQMPKPNKSKKPPGSKPRIAKKAVHNLTAGIKQGDVNIRVAKAMGPKLIALAEALYRMAAQDIAAQLAATGHRTISSTHVRRFAAKVGLEGVEPSEELLKLHESYAVKFKPPKPAAAVAA